MAAQAWFSSGDVDVTPGTTAVLHLTVVNLSDTTDTFTLTPIGMPAAWTTLRPASVTLFGGTQQVVDVEVSPPMLASTTAGPTALSVRAVPNRDPDNSATAETSLNIGESFDRRLNVLTPALRARRTATYDIMLENRGNTLASCRMHLVDPSGRVEGDFDPPAAGVEPGGSSLVRLKVRAKGMQWQRHSRTIPFRIDADQPGSPIATATASFVQSSVLPEHLVGRLVAVGGAVAALALAWVGVVKPTIRDEARTAAKQYTPSVTVASSTPAGGTGDTGTPGDGSVPSEGDIVNVPLPLSVPQGQTGANQFTVPAGKTLRVTDIIIQNPHADQGSLVVSRDGNALFTYNLSTMFADIDQPLVTPLELQAGEQLTITVTCDGLGDLTASGCAPNVLASGRLVDA